MIEFYPQIKATHILLIITSGGLFALRGALLLAGQRWVMATPLRYLSYTIDSAVLTAAMMLLVILKVNPFSTDWLATKLVLLVVYIVFGSMALKRAHSRRARTVWYIAALALFGFMYSVAKAHHPLGFMLHLMG